MHMKTISHLMALLVIATACNSAIKNTQDQVIEEPGTVITDDQPSPPTENTDLPEVLPLAGAQLTESDLIGFWVGPFEKKEKDGQDYLYVDEGFSWNRTNKINISIERLEDSLVVGKSVVAGNDRPFTGTYTKQVDPQTQAVSYAFKVDEPGDHRYDGSFEFVISDNTMKGTWTAFQDIEIKERIYTLEKRSFAYDPDIMLKQARAYVNWTNKQSTPIDDSDEFVDWMINHFESATDLIYKVNASNRLLTKAEVENMKRGDLTIIRNAIYARHGYSFKNRPLRVFFDAQPWYIPVYADIKADFTEIEKTNIQLLLKYEQNAVAYYDYFGRG